jgi:hypothetical protein
MNGLPDPLATDGTRIARADKNEAEQKHRNSRHPANVAAVVALSAKSYNP